MRCFRILVLGLCCLASQATAELDCRVVQSLTRIGMSPQFDAVQLNGAQFDINALQDMARVDPDFIAYSLQTLPDPEQARRIVQFAAVINHISALSEQDRAADIAAYLARADVRQVFSTALTALSRLGCDGPRVPDSSASKQGNSQNGSNSDAAAQGATPAQRSLQPAVVVSFAALGVALALALAMAAMIWKRMRDTKRRRARRFTVNHPARITLGDQVLDCRVTDISCGGAKLHHDGKLSPDATSFDFEFSRGQRRASVRWYNQHFVGVAFPTPFGYGELLAMLARAGVGGGRPTKNGARSGAVPSATGR